MFAKVIASKSERLFVMASVGVFRIDTAPQQIQASGKPNVEVIDVTGSLALYWQQSRVGSTRGVNTL